MLNSPVLKSEGEDWAIAWRKRAPSFERIWGDVEQRVADFLKQAAALRSWLPLNERVASLAALGAKVAGSDPALGRSVRDLVADLRERFATDNWDPVYAHAEVAARMSGLESQAQGLLFSRVKAYLGELDFLRVRFNDFLSGPAPQIAVRTPPPQATSPGRISVRFTRGHCRALRRRAIGCAHGAPKGLAWRHPTRKSQGWVDIDGQLSRALSSARSAPDFSAVIRVGEILLLMRQGFVVAAAERKETVYEGVDCAGDLHELSKLLADGLVRIRVEWIKRHT